MEVALLKFTSVNLLIIGSILSSLVQTDSLLRHIYLTTLEKLSTSGGSLNIMGHFVPVSFIYDIGGY